MIINFPSFYLDNDHPSKKIHDLRNLNIDINGISYYLYALDGEIEKWVDKRFIPIAGKQFYYDNKLQAARFGFIILPYDTLNKTLVIPIQDIKLTFLRILYLYSYTHKKCRKLNRLHEDDQLYLKEVKEFSE